MPISRPSITTPPVSAHRPLLRDENLAHPAAAARRPRLPRQSRACGSLARCRGHRPRRRRRRRQCGRAARRRHWPLRRSDRSIHEAPSTPPPDTWRRCRHGGSQAAGQPRARSVPLPAPDGPSMAMIKRRAGVRGSAGAVTLLLSSRMRVRRRARDRRRDRLPDARRWATLPGTPIFAAPHSSSAPRACTAPREPSPTGRRRTVTEERLSVPWRSGALPARKYLPRRTSRAGLPARPRRARLGSGRTPAHRIRPRPRGDGPSGHYRRPTRSRALFDLTARDRRHRRRRRRGCHSRRISRPTGASG